jgi:D-glycero-alpha-D-manno-heptose 1-phosphate guanylyltransferase
MTSAVILAGGLGTRLRKVVPDLPKPMAPINGRPFLEYQMCYWIAQGIDHFVLSVGYRYQAITNYFGHKFEGAKIEYVIEESPLGTGGGMMLAAEKVSQHEFFLLLNGDTYFAIDLQNLLDFSKKNNVDWSFSLFRTSEIGRYMGMNLLPDGRIISLQEDSISTLRLANGGVYLVNPCALSAILNLFKGKVSLEDDIFPVSIALEQRLFGKEFQNTFIDIGVPEDYKRASNLFTL